MRSAPKATSGRSRRTSPQKRDGIGAQMPALHALQDQIVAGLQRQVQMRHQARFLGDGVHQVGVGLDLVDGGKPQARQLGHVAQDLAHKAAKRRRRADRRHRR